MSAPDLIIPTFITVLVLVFFLVRMVYLSRKRGTPDQIPPGFSVHKKHWIINRSTDEAIPIQILALWMHLPHQIRTEYGNNFRIFIADPAITSWATLYKLPK